LIGGITAQHICRSSILILSILSLVLSACAPIPEDRSEIAAQVTDTAEPTPLPTETALDQPTDTPEPFSETTSAIVIESLQDLETPTPLPPLVNMPLEQLVIYEPGPGSQVNSGFRVSGWGGPSFDDRVLIRLLGEDGGVISRGWRYLYVLSGNPGRFNGTIYFNIEHVAEEARLEISTQSWRDRQTTHIFTVNLTLLSGHREIGHPQPARRRCRRRGRGPRSGRRLGRFRHTAERRHRQQPGRFIGFGAGRTRCARRWPTRNLLGRSAIPDRLSTMGAHHRLRTQHGKHPRHHSPYKRRSVAHPIDRFVVQRQSAHDWQQRMT